MKQTSTHFAAIQEGCGTEVGRFEVETAGRHEIWVILFGFCQALLNLTRKILNEKT